MTWEHPFPLHIFQVLILVEKGTVAVRQPPKIRGLENSYRQHKKGIVSPRVVLKSPEQLESRSVAAVSVGRVPE